MRDQSYHRRLKRDLATWVEMGRLTPEDAEAIVDDFPKHDLSKRLPIIVAFFGAIMICVGILAFIAANWYGVSKTFKLALIGVGMWGAYGVAGFLHARGARWLFDAVVLIGVAIYGIGIVLIAQMYHMDGHYPDAIMMVGVGALCAAWLVRSASALIVGICAITIWTGVETSEFDQYFHWPFLIVWAGAAGIAYNLAWRMGHYAVSMSLAFWATISAFSAGEALDWSHGGAITLLAATAFLALSVAVPIAHQKYEEKPDNFARELSIYALQALILAIFALQILDPKSLLTVLLAHPGLVDQLFWLIPAIVFVGSGLLVSLIWRKVIGYSTLDFTGLVLAGIVAPAFAILGLQGFVLMVLMAICIYALAIWLITFGRNFDAHSVVNLGFALFGAETLYIYYKTFGTLMDSFVFFLIGGVLLMLLAFGLDRLRKRLLSDPDTLEDGTTEGVEE